MCTVYVHDSYRAFARESSSVWELFRSVHSITGFSLARNSACRKAPVRDVIFRLTAALAKPAVLLSTTTLAIHVETLKCMKLTLFPFAQSWVGEWGSMK